MDREVFQQQFGLLGESEAIRQVVTKVMQVANTDITVLLQGESGVGKDVTARAIHSLSPRKKKELVIVNCGAIPEGIIESELFGHEKGAFTGAHEARQGYFEKADGGTIFLDEIGDTPKNVQVKLLRVLESGEFSRVGSSSLSKTDVRVIAATNRDMWQMVKEGTFREDLYYRLDTVKIQLPPLRERQRDILPLFRKFAGEYATRYDSVFKGLTEDATELLTSYRWPGNIRELRNVAEQLVVLEKSQIVDKEKLQKYLKGRQQMGSTDHLPILSAEFGSGKESSETGSIDSRLIYRALLEMKSELSDLKRLMGNMFYSTVQPSSVRALPPGIPQEIDPNDITSHLSNRVHGNSDDGAILQGKTGSGHFTASPSPLYTDEPIEEPDEVQGFFAQEDLPSIEEAERFLIEQALEKYDGNRRKASEVLGISERTLYRKLDQFGLI